MNQRSYFLVVRMMSTEGVDLVWGKDIFTRPMPWGIWLSAICPRLSNPWRFIRVFGLSKPEHEYRPYIEDGRIYFEDQAFLPEAITPLLVAEWIVQSLYYKTSLKFWNWPMFKQ